MEVKRRRAGAGRALGAPARRSARQDTRRAAARRRLLRLAGAIALGAMAVWSIASNRFGGRGRLRWRAGEEAGKELLRRGERAAARTGNAVDLAEQQRRKAAAAAGAQPALRDDEQFDVLVVGAGLSGTVLADLYARMHDKRVLVLERRPHVGGNCFDFREEKTDILVNLYGAHLFHTSKEEVWQYMHRFSEWVPYEHRVVGLVDGKLVPIPVNIDTVNALLGEAIGSVEEMEAWLERERRSSGVTGASPANSREVGVGRVGKRLYDKLFREYTKKQWSVYPEELGPEVLSRIPVRTDWDDRYFPNDPYQALPAWGYTRWFEEALDHPNIRVLTSTDYFELSETPGFRARAFEKTFFTGQIDQFFLRRGKGGLDLQPLQYRSIRFEAAVVEEPSVSQPAFVVNFPQFRDGQHTRTVEYKHMYHQTSRHSVLVSEFSTDTREGQEPYYPFPTEANQKQFEKFQRLAEAEEAANNVFFVGRLANYKYFNMDDAVANALQLYRRIEGGGGELAGALAQGAERVAPDSLMRVHVVLVVAPGYDVTTWFGDLCADHLRVAAGTTIALSVFVYNTDRLQDLTVAAAIRGLALARGCGPLREGVTLFARNIAPAPVHAVWLEHLSRDGFSFGDSTVFLQSSPRQRALQEVGAALEIQSRRLFAEARSRAAQPLVSREDIRNVPRRGEPPARAGPLAFAQAGFLHMLPLAGRPSRNPEDPLPAWAAAAVPHAASCDLPMGTAQFVASDAGLRRMLAVHRTAAYDTWMPALRQASQGQALSRALASAWPCLFFPPPP